MNFYLEQVAKPENEVHLLYWNRDEKADISLAGNVNLHEFKLYQVDDIAKIKKIRSFIKYRKNAKNLLHQEKFDLVIVMHTIPAVLLYDELKSKYKNKYILDYRDITFEHNWLYRKVIHKLVEMSVATFVSSDAFRSFLPDKKEIYASHNLLRDSNEHRDIRRRRPREVYPLRIRFWGFIRHENINRAVIDRLANDHRFELHYHGREQEIANNLKEYVKEHYIHNVFFHGEYTPEERYMFAAETELLHNLYENDTATQPAMGNKFYDGLTLYIPQLCSNGSYMGKQITENNIGLACDPLNPAFADNVYKYYKSIHWLNFEENCNRKLNEVLLEYEKGIDVIEKIGNVEI